MREALHIALFVSVFTFSACSTRERAEECVFDRATLDYSACERGMGCEGPSTCTAIDWRYGNGSLCTRACESELDCPGNGPHQARCLLVDGAPTFLCIQSCGSNSDCGSGQVCQPLQSGGKVCLP